MLLSLALACSFDALLRCLLLLRLTGAPPPVLQRDDEMSMLVLQSGADAFIADRDCQNAVSLASKRQRTVLFANMDR